MLDNSDSDRLRQIVQRHTEACRSGHTAKAPAPVLAGESPWPARDDELRALWNEGLTGAEIAVRMGLTKNAVIGRANRIGLPGRPSPIVRKIDPRITARNVAARHLNKSREAEGMAPTYLAIKPGFDAPRIGHGKCKWPMWADEEKPTHVYCDQPNIEGRPYCALHHQIAYVPKGSARYRHEIAKLASYPGGIGADTAHKVAG